MSGRKFYHGPVPANHHFMIHIADCWGLVRFLDLIKPFVPLLPEVAAPERKVPFQQRLMWTGVIFQYQRDFPLRDIH